MGHPARLARLAFAAGNESIPATMAAIGDAVASAPKLRGNAMIDHIPHHVGAATVLNQPERIAPELKILSSLIDTIGAVTFDVDAPLHIGQEFIERRRARLQPDVRDTHHRHAPPTIGPVRSA